MILEYFQLKLLKRLKIFQFLLNHENVFDFEMVEENVFEFAFQVDLLLLVEGFETQSNLPKE